MQLVVLVNHIVVAGRSEALSLAAVAMWGFILGSSGRADPGMGGGVGAVGGGRGLPPAALVCEGTCGLVHIKREELPGSAAFMCRVWSVCW